MAYVYKNSERNLWTVGAYTPDGEWEPESDHSSSESAAKRVAVLNGGPYTERDGVAIPKLSSSGEYQDDIDRMLEWCDSNQRSGDAEIQMIQAEAILLLAQQMRRIADAMELMTMRRHHFDHRTRHRL